MDIFKEIDKLADWDYDTPIQYVWYEAKKLEQEIKTLKAENKRLDASLADANERADSLYTDYLNTSEDRDLTEAENKRLTEELKSANRRSEELTEMANDLSRIIQSTTTN